MAAKREGGPRVSAESRRGKRSSAAGPKSPAGDAKFWGVFQPEARISARTLVREGARGGAPGLVFLRPQDDPDDGDWPEPDDEPGDGDDPCSNQPLVHVPLVAAQLDLTSGGPEAVCPSEADLERIVQAVRAQFGRLVPEPDVRVRCVDRVLTIGVWKSGNVNDACQQQARDRALGRLDLIEAGENFGFLLGSSLITQQAQAAFAAGPKQLAGNGAPSPFGPVHLTGLSVEFVAPDTVRTRVTGYDDRPWPDVGFTLTISDVVDDAAVCTTSSSVNTHGAWKAVLGAILLGGATFFLPQLLPLTFFVVFGDLEAAAGQQGGDGNGDGGVGCRALSMVPAEIPLPNGSKLVILYRRSQVTVGGLFFGGLAVRATRRPTASIVGPARVLVAEHGSFASASFQVRTTDTFGRLSAAWATGAGFTVANPSWTRTKITFSRGNLTPTSPALRRTIRVTVADQDGFVQTLSREVEVLVIESDGLPAVCRVKPWLPQCQP
jgi:hypothetical protein